MKKIAFILHGKIKGRDKLIAQLKSLFNQNYELDFLVSEYAQHAMELSFQAAQNGATHIICVGGDGSLNEVVNGIIKTRDDGEIKGSEIQVGILPRGTGNDFARTVDVSLNLPVLKKYIDEGSYRQIDLGLVHYQNTNNETSSRYFINIADVGIGGMIAQKLTTASKFLGAVFIYQKAILGALITYKNKPVRLKTDNFEYEGKIRALLVANGKYIGGGLGLAPDALQDDGLFSIVVAGEISVFDYLKNLGNMRKCKRINHPEMKYYSAREARIESLSEPLPIDMDGEFIGYSPLTVTIVPKALKFICGR